MNRYDDKTCDRMAKLMRDRHERESNAPTTEQLDRFITDMKLFLTSRIGKHEKKTLINKIWTSEIRLLLDFAQRDMGMFTTNQLIHFLPALQTTSGKRDLRKWLHCLRNRAVHDPAFFECLVRTAFHSVPFYRSQKNCIVMPRELELDAQAEQGSLHARYDCLAALVEELPPVSTAAASVQPGQESVGLRSPIGQPRKRWQTR